MQFVRILFCAQALFLLYGACVCAVAGGLELIASTLSRLSSSEATEDKEGFHATLSLLENMVECAPTLASQLCDSDATRVPVLPILMHRLRDKSFDHNKLYASEILSILLQADVPVNAQRLGSGMFSVTSRSGGSSSGGGGGGRTLDGVEYMLECINVYKKRDPESTDEEECVENLFDCLCTLLVRSTKLACELESGYSVIGMPEIVADDCRHTCRHYMIACFFSLHTPTPTHMLLYACVVCLQLRQENCDRLRAAEGFELLLRIMHEAGFARFGALKALSFAVAHNPHNCEAFIDAG